MPFHSPNQHRNRTLLIALSAIFHSTNGFADNTSPTPNNSEVQLDPVVVTSQRGTDTNTVVRSNRIDVEQANNLRDIFKQTPEVNVSGGQSTAQKLYVRGISERMLTITIDGASQPESAYHHTGQVMIEPELLKRVEIEAGTGAATAGPGALGGALRFTTKNAEDLLRPNEKFGALLKGGLQSNNEGNKLSSTIFGRLGENSSFIASLAQQKSSDYKDGNGNTVANSATDTLSEFVKFNTTLAQGHTLSLSHERNQDEGLRNTRTNLLPASFNLAERQRTERESTALNYEYKPGNPLIQSKFSLYSNDNAITLAQGQPTEEQDGTKSYGLNIGNISTLKNHKLSYGYNYRQDTGYVNLTASGALPDETAKVHGVYLQDDYALTDTLLLGMGVRYDQYDYTDIANQNYQSNGFSPNANLTWSATDQLTFRISQAKALRGVGIVEPFLKQLQTNDAHIDPEKARNTELGVQWDNGTWNLNGTVFRQRIDNYIGYDDFRDNMGTVKVNGYSASLGYRNQNWSSSLGVSHAKPRLNGAPLSDDNALLLGTATGRTWATQIDYTMPNQPIKLGWTGRFVERLTDVPSGTPEKAGYAAHDVYTQWNPKGKEDFSVTLSIKNIFNKYYLDQGSFGYNARWGSIAGLPEPGRDVRLTLAWRI